MRRNKDGDWRSNASLLFVLTHSRQQLPLPCLPTLSPIRLCAVEAVAIAVNVPRTMRRARTSPELLTWRDDRERDFCGELDLQAIDTAHIMATQARGPPGTVPVNTEGVPNRT